MFKSWLASMRDIPGTEDLTKEYNKAAPLLTNATEHLFYMTSDELRHQMGVLVTGN